MTGVPRAVIPYDPFAVLLRTSDQPFANVRDYGALGDGRTVSATLSIGSATLTLTSGTLTAADVGRSIAIPGGGGSGTALATTISTVTDASHATLAASASAAVVGVTARICSDDSAAIQSALDGNLCVVIPAGTFGFTRLRLRSGHVLIGAGPTATELVRIGVGSGGAAIAMTSGQIAQGVGLANFLVRGMQVGTALNGIDLGTETPGTTDFALGGFISNVEVWAATGWQFRLRVNVAHLTNVWAEAQEATAQATVGGFYINGTCAIVNGLSAEGNMPAGLVLSEAGASLYDMIQIQTTGVNATTDIISIGGNGHLINAIYLFGAGTYRDLVRITAGVQYTTVKSIFQDPTRPTLTNTINDVQNTVTIPNIGSGGWTDYTQDTRTNLVNLGTYANNAAAIAAGLKRGQMYRVNGADPGQIAVVF